MREITLRYVGECRKCGATVPVGEQAIYERRVGIFCLSCGPTEAEEIREYRQEAAERRAEKYEEWAQKRRVEANASLERNRQLYRGDWAFVTQPGHIPLRARINRQDEKAFENLAVADAFEDKAQRLRRVSVAGDAEARREARRECVRTWAKVGMMVEAPPFPGIRKLLKVNAKTALVEGFGGLPIRVELAHLLQAPDKITALAEVEVSQP